MDAAARHPGQAPAADGRARHGAHAPVAQRARGPGDTRPAAGGRDRAARERFSRRRSGEAAAALPGAGGARDAGPRRSDARAAPRYPAKRKLGEYFRENFHITTSGNFRTQTLIDAILELGADRIMFSTDWPFENIDHAAEWFDAAAIAEADRMKIGRSNALRLFRLAASA